MVHGTPRIRSHTEIAVVLSEQSPISAENAGVPGTPYSILGLSLAFEHWACAIFWEAPLGLATGPLALKNSAEVLFERCEKRLVAKWPSRTLV
jgi:hypothetical protein